MMYDVVMVCDLKVVWIVLVICIVASLFTTMVSEIVKARYDYWTEYDKGVTDNLNKQLQYNKEKLKRESKEKK